MKIELNIEMVFVLYETLERNEWMDGRTNEWVNEQTQCLRTISKADFIKSKWNKEALWVWHRPHYLHLDKLSSIENHIYDNRKNEPKVERSRLSHLLALCVQSTLTELIVTQNCGAVFDEPPQRIIWHHWKSVRNRKIVYLWKQTKWNEKFMFEAKLVVNTLLRGTLFVQNEDPVCRW